MKRTATCGRYAIALAAAAAVAGLAPAAAKERLSRQLGAELASAPQYVNILKQDAAGHLWVGGAGGLYRYDGAELRRWITGPNISQIAIGPDGRLYAAAHDGGIFRVNGDGFERVPSPTGEEWRNTRKIEVDDEGRLWAITADRRLWRQGPDGSWEEPLAGRLEGEQPALVRRDGDGMLVAATRGLWRVAKGDRVERVVALPPHGGWEDVLRLPDGGLFLATWDGPVLEYRDGQLTERARMVGRARALARRGDTVWVAGDGNLAAIRPGQPTEYLPATESYRQRGLTVLVDREGSLWVGHARGAFQFPEPDTVAWQAADGVPAGNMRLALTREGLWFTFWGGGLGIVERGPPPTGGWRARVLDQKASLDLCVTRNGTLWGEAEWPGEKPTRIFSRTAGGDFRFHGPPGKGFHCRETSDGGLWIATGQALHHVSADDVLTSVGPPQEGTRAIAGSRPREDSRGTLWMIDSGQDPPALCRAPAQEVRAGRNGGWTCLALPGVYTIEAIEEMPSGALWLAPRWQASDRSGLLRYDGQRMETVPGSQELPTPSVQLIAPARDGGVWVSGPKYLWRVREHTELAAGWSVEERLGPIHGVMSDGAFAVVEDEDGVLWATTAAGILQIPPSARVARDSSPHLELLRATVNGRAVDPAGPIDVPYGHNEVALDVSALLFRDPASVRYRLRLGPDAPWSTPSRSSRIQLVDVPPGSYRVELAASTDERAWTEPLSLMEFAVPTPWHRRPWAWILAAALVLGAALAVQRARLAVRLRLERQRTRIALDLHDEMGSGLGSIRVLAGLAARETADPELRRTAAGRIERTARDLGQALTGIVWSLRDSGRALRDLLAHVAERGQELFPEDTPALQIAFPAAWPAENLSLSTRRNLQLILMEALYNAARHARARRVVLGALEEDGRWRLWVEDDGVGLAPPTPPRHAGGNGLPGMRQRADQIGASLTVGPARDSPSGTRVEVTLLPARFVSLRLAPTRAARLDRRQRST